MKLGRPLRRELGGDGQRPFSPPLEGRRMQGTRRAFGPLSLPQGEGWGEGCPSPEPDETKKRPAGRRGASHAFLRSRLTPLRCPWPSPSLA